MKKAISYTLYFLGIQLLVSFAVSMVLILLGMKHDMLQNLIWSSGISSILTIVIFLWLKFAEVSRNYFRSGPWLVLLFAVFLSLGTLVPSTWFQEQMPDLPDLVKNQMALLMKSQVGFFIVVLLAPFVEELVFRGAVLRALLSWSHDKAGWLGNHWTMIVISALFFSFVHLNPAQMPHAFVIGILLGWLYYRTNSIIPGIALHWTNNVSAYVVFSFFPDPDMKLVQLFGSQNNVILAFIYSVLIFVPSIYMLNRLMKRV
jgi:membrane protease YdiL (CAAX protease family)